MFSIMKLLCTKETLDLIRNCGVGVISMYSQKKTVNAEHPPMFDGVGFSKQLKDYSPEVRSNFIVCCREQAARRPPRNIHDLKPSRHLRHLHWVHSAERMYRLAFLGGSVEDGIKLVGKQCGRKG
jgi:hypothetical protein